MERAGITDPADVHYVQTKTPLLTIHTISDAKSRGKTVWTENTHESMDLSNGCTALGIAVALGEIECRPTPTSCTTARCTRRSPRARRESSLTRRRSWLPATRAASAAGTGSATRSCGTRSTPTASGRRSRTPASSCPSGRVPPTWTGGWSTCSSSARPARTARCAAAATPCSTTPTCTGIARSRPVSAAWRRR